MNYLPGISLLIIIAIGAVELLLSASWSRIYFNTGIPIVKRIIPVDVHHSTVPNRVVLEEPFKAQWFDFTRSLIFQELDTNMYGFRESLFRRSISLMHGFLIFDGQNNQVIVKGFLNWTPLALAILALFVPSVQWWFGRQSSEFVWLITGLGIFYVFFAICVWVDYMRVSAVAQFAAQSWARKNPSGGGG